MMLPSTCKYWSKVVFGAYLQNGHAECKPEVLLFHDVQPIQMPRLRGQIVAIAQDDKDPGYLLT
jgi:hypothetical protein